MGKKSKAEAPPPPEQISAFEPMTAFSLFNKINSSGPFGSQRFYRTDPETGELIEWNPSDPDTLAAIDRALADPSNPDIGLLMSVMPSDVRMIEDDRVRTLREGGQDNDWMRQNIASMMLGQIPGMEGMQGLPESAFGLDPNAPAGATPGLLGGSGAGDQSSMPFGISLPSFLGGTGVEPSMDMSRFRPGGGSNSMGMPVPTAGPGGFAGPVGPANAQTQAPVPANLMGGIASALKNQLAGNVRNEEEEGAQY